MLYDTTKELLFGTRKTTYGRGLMENKIREIRRSKGILAEELASRLGVHTNTVLNWERGDTDISIRYLVPMAKELNCSVNAILGIAE
jgi:transcriptional regulator with XRE-family HTH domain